MTFIIPLIIVATLLTFVALISLVAGPARPLTDDEATQLR